MREIIIIEEENGQADIENEGMLYGYGSNEESCSEKDMAGTIREPLPTSQMNTTSQIVLVGANICPSESLDYEYE